MADRLWTWEQQQWMYDHEEEYMILHGSYDDELINALYQSEDYQRLFGDRELDSLLGAWADWFE